MKKARLQIRLDEDLKKRVEAVASVRRTTLSALVIQYFVDLTLQSSSDLQDSLPEMCATQKKATRETS